MQGGDKGDVMKSNVVRVNVIVMLVAIVGFFVVYSRVTNVGDNRVLNGTPYSKGYYATYSIEGPLAEKLGGNRLGYKVVSVENGMSRIEVNAGSEKSAFELREMEGTLAAGDEEGKPLIFFANIPSAFPMIPTTWHKFYGYRDEGKLDINFSRLYTGIKDEYIWNVKNLREDSFVYYHEKYGPNASYRFVANDGSVPLGHIIIDQTSGLMLHAENYTNGGKSTLELLESNYPTTANRWNFFYWPNGILLLWGIWHLWRLKKHPEAQYFEMTTVNMARFFVRLLAFTVFDFGLFGGASILTGNLMIHVIVDAIGFLVMLFGVGIYAFMVLFKFTGLVPGFIYPYGVPLYLCAILAYEINSYRMQKRANASAQPANDNE